MNIELLPLPPDGNQLERAIDDIFIDIYTALGIPAELLTQATEQNAAHARMVRENRNVASSVARPRSNDRSSGSESG